MHKKKAGVTRVCVCVCVCTCMFHYILVSDSSNVGIDGVHVSKQHVGSFRVCGYVSLHEGCASIIPSPLLLLSYVACSTCSLYCK